MTKQTWISVYGNAKIKDGTITHVPVLAERARSATPSADAAPPLPPHTVLRCNLEFDQGTIAFEARLGERDARIQLMLPAEPSAGATPDFSKSEITNQDLSAGLNVLGAPYGFAFWNGAWEAAGGAGQGSALPINEWIPVRVTAKGSVIDLYIHDVKVASTSRTLKRGQIGMLLQGNKECSARNIRIVEDAPTCFVVIQFTDQFDILFKDVIRPVCELHGYKVIRGDDFYTTGQIMEDVTQSIRTAALIIADVTPDNPNVFYEVGFAHAINKPTILLSDKKREHLPFDISGFRTLFYDNTIGGKAIVEARLKQHLEALRPR